MKNRMKVVLLIIASLCAACSPDAHQEPANTTAIQPTVNDQNCKREHIATLDPSIRTKFADACFRRGTFKPSSGQGY